MDLRGGRRGGLRSARPYAPCNRVKHILAEQDMLNYGMDPDRLARCHFHEVECWAYFGG